MQRNGRTEYFALGLASLDGAAAKAQEIYLFLVGHGWEETMAKYKPRFADDSISVGEFLKAAETAIDVAPGTWRNYRKFLRQIVSEVGGVDAVESRFDPTGGCKNWREAVDAKKLGILTRKSIEKWRKDYLARNGADPESERKARTTCNSVVRNAAALFNGDLLGKMGLKIENPFADVKSFKAPARGYNSKFDAERLLSTANKKLMKPQKEGESGEDYLTRTEAFKALVIFGFTGMRRKELDLLLWEQVNLREGHIDLRHTKYFRPKAESSVGRIPLAPDAVTVLQGFRARAPEDEFVMKGGKPNLKATYTHYRAAKSCDFLIKWLKEYDVDGETPLANVQKPLHELRKEVGAILTTRHGIYAAKTILRHSSIAVTSAFYSDQKEQVTVGIKLSQ